MKKLTIGLLSLTVLFTACKKDKDAPAITKENIAGSYKVIAEVSKEEGQAEVDDYAAWPACEKDDVEKFNLDGSYLHIDAATVCDPAGDAESTWSVEGDTFSIGEQQYAVTKFDGSILELKFSDIGYTVKVTLQKQ